jgi:hypothetical protein
MKHSFKFSLVLLNILFVYSSEARPDTYSSRYSPQPINKGAFYDNEDQQNADISGATNGLDADGFVKPDNGDESVDENQQYKGNYGQNNQYQGNYGQNNQRNNYGQQSRRNANGYDQY